MDQFNNFSNYKSMNSMQFNNPMMTPFNRAFETQPSLLEKQNFKNNHTLLHNNVAENIVDENVVEYRLYIDSFDRDIRYYQDPFSFTVKFNPAGSSVVRNEEKFLTKNKKIQKSRSVETRFEGSPAPHIMKEFKNVKYVKLENIVLPQFTKIRPIKGKNPNKWLPDDKDDKYEFDPESHLFGERYVSMVIKELESERILSTAEGMTRYDDKGETYNYKPPFALILPDKILGKSFYSGTSCYGTRVYKSTALSNITQLTIEFYDSVGIPLKYNDLLSFEDMEQFEFDNGTEFPITDLRHPLNKKIQVCFTLVIGVVENCINTFTQF